MSAFTLLLIAAGGSAGAMGRYGICEAQSRLTSWPGWTGVLAANLMGCLIMGLAAGWPRGGPWTEMLVMTGLCGALTTFSSFALDLALLWLGGQRRAALSCVSLSAGLGIPLVMLGELLGGLIS